MIRNALSHLALPVITLAALIFAAGPVLAQHGGGHGGGGVHAGAFHTGGYPAGSFHTGYYHGGVGGYGYQPYYGYRAEHPYYHGYYASPYYGFGYYPYSDFGYYPFDTQSYYYDTGSYPYYATSPLLSSEAATSTPISSTSTLNPSTPSQSLPVHITVRLPDNADLWVNGTKMTPTGAVREFVTPSLTPGQKYSYEIRARWTDNDRTTDREQTVVFAPGDNLEVLFPASRVGETAKAMVTAR